MKLIRLSASRYRCLREVTFGLGDLNVFIGPNASGKSSILDALRFLREGVQQRDFQPAVQSRLGILALAWMGDEQRRVSLTIELSEGEHRYEWSVILDRRGNDFATCEAVCELDGDSGRTQLLESNEGRGWWLSGDNRRVPLAQGSRLLSSRICDAEMPARGLRKSFCQSW